MSEFVELGGYIVSGDTLLNHDVSLSGNGTFESPLGVVPGYNETVLFFTATYNNQLSAIPLNEPASAFERLRIYDSKSHVQEFWWNSIENINAIMLEHNTTGNRWVTYWALNTATTQDIKFTSGWLEQVSGGVPNLTNLNTIPVGAPYGRFVHPMKIIGINRIK